MEKIILVTGGAGFVGSNLIKELLKDESNFLIVFDDLSTGKFSNIEPFLHLTNFAFFVCDISNNQEIESALSPYKHVIHQIYHLAAPASPPKYSKNPIKTIETITFGTYNVLKLAEKYNSTILLSSTSEIYGDPLQHPQKESYFGNTNCFGPRSCYDESKRLAETLFYEFHKQRNLNVRIARIFNTYGPNMDRADGRVISNFIDAALNNRDILVYGDGNQTRSFQYISDLVEGLIKLMNSDITRPINLGNPNCEMSINEIAKYILTRVENQTVGKVNSKIIHCKEVIDDPKVRKPDITLASSILNWKPKVSLEDGIKKTIDFFSLK